MGAFEDRRRQGHNGTDLPSLDAVQKAIQRIVRRKYSGWPSTDQEDLVQDVLAKYFKQFGRLRLPDDASGNPAVPIPWLNTVILTTAIDQHRKDEVRPEDAADFNGSAAYGFDRLLHALTPKESLSTDVAFRIDVRRRLQPALKALGEAHPMDVKLIEWRYVKDRDVDWIAKTIVKTPATTRRAVSRAVERLRDLLTDSGNVTDDD